MPGIFHLSRFLKYLHECSGRCKSAKGAKQRSALLIHVCQQQIIATSISAFVKVLRIILAVQLLQAAELNHGLAKSLFVGVCELGQGKPGRADVKALHIEGSLDRDRVDFDEKLVD